MHALNLRVVLLYGDLTELDHDVHQGYAYIIMSVLCANVVDCLMLPNSSSSSSLDGSVVLFLLPVGPTPCHQLNSVPLGPSLDWVSFCTGEQFNFSVSVQFQCIDWMQQYCKHKNHCGRVNSFCRNLCVMSIESLFSLNIIFVFWNEKSSEMIEEALQLASLFIQEAGIMLVLFPWA